MESSNAEHPMMIMEENQQMKEADQVTKEKSKRVASLDIFRGLTVAMMILVDDAGGEWQMIGHAPWNGCNLADFVMPFFLFIVGMAIALAFKRIPNRLLSIKRVIIRTIKLILWGLILQGGYSHAPDELTYGVDMKRIRWCGILQRIALSYLVVAILEISTKDGQAKDLLPGWQPVLRQYHWHWLAGTCVLVVYLSVIYGAYVPRLALYCLQHLKALIMGRLLIACSSPKVVQVCTESSPYEGPFRKDAASWCQAPFEPEGLLSSISAILTTIIGVHFGHVLVHIKVDPDHSDRLKHWGFMGFFLLLLGIILHFTNAIPLNKQLYSFSYVCLTAGAAAWVFSTFYVLVDILGWRHLFLPLEWIGMNAMLVYVMAAEGIFAGFINGWYYEDPHNTLIYWIQKHIFIGVWHLRRIGMLLYVILQRSYSGVLWQVLCTGWVFIEALGTFT
ncbi:hypothetical protein IFM89_021475 [Coptis chinensis]|uniref:Heparan-alpha-glucosaminide N-acetyltransferase catalytic domain-containing protein n=1 Tax=Coptis chinensis TaxID=261450 RepID=A0A835INY9_9MAGN|nr:hypothetical protein IFM89_021475 [Coptis chinensis]